jgi:hypothetical protein
MAFGTPNHHGGPIFLLRIVLAIQQQNYPHFLAGRAQRRVQLRVIDVAVPDSEAEVIR